MNRSRLRNRMAFAARPNIDAIAPGLIRSRTRFVVQFNPLDRIVRPPSGLPEVICESDTLEVRLARTTKDIRRAQRLRYKVFFEEMNATPNAFSRFSRRDVDSFDRICDHLLVIDRQGKRDRLGRRKPKVVGTYRLLRSDIARAHGADFYTSSEFDIAGVLKAHPGAQILELGRSCVAREYRTRRVIDLLWAALWRYVEHHRIDLMLGCASFDGTDCNTLDEPLSFLHHFAPAPSEWRAAAHPWKYSPMNRLPRDLIDRKSAMKALPPLIKGYLRIGATFGNGAVVDREFGTVDVLVLLRVADIEPRYIQHFAAGSIQGPIN